MWSASRMRSPAVCSSSPWDRLGHLPMYANRTPHYHNLPSSVNPPHNNYAENRLQKPCSLLSSNNVGELCSATVPREHPQFETRRYTSRSRLPTRSRIDPVLRQSLGVVIEPDNEAAMKGTLFESLSKSTDTPLDVISDLKQELVDSVGGVDPLMSVLKDKTYPQEIEELTEHIYKKKVKDIKRVKAPLLISPKTGMLCSNSYFRSKSSSTFLHSPESRLGLTERDPLLLYCPLAGSPGVRDTNHECLNTYRISQIRDYRFGLKRQGDVAQISPDTSTNFGAHATSPLSELKPEYIQWLLNKNMLYRKPRLRLVLALMGRIECLLPFEYPYFRPCPIRTLSQVNSAKSADFVDPDYDTPLGPPIPPATAPSRAKKAQMKVKKTEEKLWDVINFHYPIKSPMRVTDGELSTPDEAFVGPQNVRVALSEVEEEAVYEDLHRRRKQRALENTLGKPAFWAIGDTHTPRTFLKYRVRHMLLLRLFRLEDTVNRKERKKRYLCDADREKLMDRLSKKVEAAEKKSAKLIRKLSKKTVENAEELQESANAQNTQIQKMEALLETLRNSPGKIPDSVLPELFRRQQVESQILLSSILREKITFFPEDDEHRLMLAVALQLEHYERTEDSLLHGDEPSELTDPDAFHPSLPSPLSLDNAAQLRKIIVAVKTSMKCRLQKEYEKEGYTSVPVPLHESANTPSDTDVDNAHYSMSTTATSTSTFASVLHTRKEGPLANANTNNNTSSPVSIDNSSDSEAAEEQAWEDDPLGFNPTPRRPFEWSHGLSQAVLTRNTTEEAHERNYALLTPLDKPVSTIDSIFQPRPMHPRVQKCLEPYRKLPTSLPPNFVFCSTVSASVTGSKTQYDLQHMCHIAALDGLNREFSVMTRPQFNYSELMRFTTYYMDNNFQRFWLSPITPSQGVLSFISWLFNPELGRFRVNHVYVPKEARMAIGDEFLYLNAHDIEEVDDSIDTLIKAPHVNEKNTPRHPVTVHYTAPRERPRVEEDSQLDDTDLSVEMLVSFASNRGQARNKGRAFLEAIAAGQDVQAYIKSKSVGASKRGKKKAVEGPVDEVQMVEEVKKPAVAAVVEHEVQEGDSSEYEWVEEGTSDGENPVTGDGATTTSTPVSFSRVFLGTSYRDPFARIQTHQHPLDVAAIVKQYQRLCAMDDVSVNAESPREEDEEVDIREQHDQPQASQKRVQQEEEEDEEEEEDVVRSFTGIGSVGYCLSRCGMFTARQKRQQKHLASLPSLPELGNGAVDAIYEEVIDVPDAIYTDNPYANAIYNSTIVNITNFRELSEDVTKTEAYHKSMFPSDMHEGAQTIALKADFETTRRYVPFQVPDLERARANLQSHQPENELLDMPARDPIFLFGYRIGFWTIAHLDCELRRMAMNAQRADYDELLRFFTDNHERMEMLQECHPELAANAIRNLFIESGIFLIDLVEILRKYYDMYEPGSQHAWVLSNVHAQVTELDRPLLGQDALLHVHMLKEIFYADNDMGAFIRCEVDRSMNMARRTFVSTQKKNQFPKFPNLGRTTFVSHAEFLDYMRRVAELDLTEIQNDFLDETLQMAPAIPSIRTVIEEKIAQHGGEEYRAQLVAEALAREARETPPPAPVEGRTRRPSKQAYDAINKLF